TTRRAGARLAGLCGPFEVDDLPLPAAFHRLVEVGMLASQIDPFDPMERAIKQVHEQHLVAAAGGPMRGQLVQAFPLSDRLMAVIHVSKLPHTDYPTAA